MRTQYGGLKRNPLKNKSKLGQHRGTHAKGEESVTRQRSITSCQKLSRIIRAERCLFDLGRKIMITRVKVD